MTTSHHSLRADDGAWTAADQVALDALTARKQRNKDACFEDVAELITKLRPRTDLARIERIAQMLVDNSHRFVEVLTKVPVEHCRDEPPYAPHL